MGTIQYRGTQGSWNVEVTYADGTKEVLPTAHRLFWKVDRDGPYFQRGPSDVGWQHYTGRKKKFAAYMELLKAKKRVVVTNDDFDMETGFAKRTGYVAVYDVADISLDADGLFYRFVNRIKQ
jgi:hypothetical protein